MIFGFFSKYFLHIITFIWPPTIIIEPSGKHLADKLTTIAQTCGDHCLEMHCTATCSFTFSYSSFSLHICSHSRLLAVSIQVFANSTMRKSNYPSTSSSESFQSSSGNSRKSHGSSQDAGEKGTYKQYKDRVYNHTRIDLQNHPIKAPVFKEYIVSRNFLRYLIYRISDHLVDHKFYSTTWNT